MAKLDYVDNVFLRTTDPKAMIDFYTQNFDLPVVYADGCVSRLQVGPEADRAMIAIVDDNHVVGDRLSLISFHVADIEAAFKEVEEKNIKRCDTHIRTFGENNQFHYFNVIDPAGNIVTLVQPT